MPTMIVWPGDAEAAGVHQVGGKAMGLAQLEAAGARVPPWAVVPADVLHASLERAGVAGEAAARLGAFSRHEIGADEAGASLQAMVQGVRLDPATAGAIDDALGKLGPGPWAVRSSMAEEDSGVHSWAGQLESFLCLPSPPEVAEAVVKVWASAFAPRALAYARQAGLAPAIPRVGVLLQRMVPGDVSGVLFTAHPVTGRRDHVLLTAAWGLGEGIVSGRVNADDVVVAHDGSEVSARIADKDVAVVPAPDGATGTVEMAVADDRRRIRCLPHDTARQLALEGVRLATAIGMPLDVEWTVVQGTPYTLQARPITALPPAPAPVPAPSGPRVVWDNSNIQESYCGVTTPLTFSFARAAYAAVYEQTFRAFGLPEDEIGRLRPIFAHLLGLVRGRVYYNINNWYRALLVLPSFGRNKADMEKMMGLDRHVDFVEDQLLSPLEKLARAPRLLGTLVRLKRHIARLPRTVPRFLADFEQVVASVDRAALQTAPLSDLVALAARLKREVIGSFRVPIFNDFHVMMASGRLRRLVALTQRPDAPALIAQMLSGEPGIESTEPTRRLMRLAKSARADPALHEALAASDPTSALARARAASPAFAADVDAYIERYGDRCMGELKLETITLRQDPGFLVKVLRNYLERPDLDPDRLTDLERHQRDEAEATVRAELPWWGRPFLPRELRRTREAIKNRENMRLARTRGFGIIRDVYLAIGSRLHEAARLDAPRDVLYLAMEEIDHYHDGLAVSADLAALARARKAEFAAYERLELPHHFETTGAVHHGNVLEAPPVEAADRAVRLLQGTGCYPGVVEAVARVILSPRDDLSVNGRILTTLRTDPGWAPLFPGCAGILVERGSTLSHSAVVARELGIPAVVGVPHLLSIVKDGERLRLDGGQGTVERLDAEAGR